MEQIDFNKIEYYVDNSLISKRKHPIYDLHIYNYTAEVQYKQLWNTETKICRGLILDKDNNIIALPFPKFFNYQEVKEDVKIRQDLSFTVHEKLDGSLGILYYYDNDWHMATRGSFTSPQSAKGLELLKKLYPQYKDLCQYQTHLFEIIYPENRIVVQYDKEDMIYLDSINLSDKARSDCHIKPTLNKAKEYTVDDIQNLLGQQRSNFEGYVIKYEDNYRVKVKLDEYVRLHKILSNLTDKTIWEWLSTNTDYKPLLENIPDETYNYIETTANELTNQHTKIYNESNELYNKNKHLLDISKKDFALAVKDYKYSSLVFSLANNKDINQDIWKYIKPETT